MVPAAKAPSPLHFSDHQIGRGRAFYDHACALKVEGIVSKRVDAPYAPGNRGLWLKIKSRNREEFGGVGWTDPEGARPWLGALLLPDKTSNPIALRIVYPKFSPCCGPLSDSILPNDWRRPSFHTASAPKRTSAARS